MNKTENQENRSFKEYHRLIKTAIVLIAVCGIAICVYWFPLSVFVFRGNAEVAHALYWAELIFDWTAAIPCFVILGFLWRVSDLAKEEKLFSDKAVKCFHNSALILFIDLIFFLIGNIAFFCMGINVWITLYIFLMLCGCAVDLFFFIISKFLHQAAILQEESDGTI